MRHVPIRYLAFLFTAFVLMSLLASVGDIGAEEARLLWIVRDPEKVEPAAAGDTARVLVRNFRAMIDRAEPRDLPLAVPLDLWTLLAGGSAFAARMTVVLPATLAMALLLRLTRRRAPRLATLIGWGVPLAALIGYALTPATLSPTVADFHAARKPDEPVITLFRDDSPLGYYQAQMDLRRGIGVDLGWRPFSDAEIERVVANLGTGMVWVVMDVDADVPYDAVNDAILASGRVLTRCRGLYTHIAVLRYAVSGFTPVVTCSAP